MSKSHLEESFIRLWRAMKLGPMPKREHVFAPPRKWRIDFFWQCGVGVEIEGGVWSGGRHTRGAGFQKDLEKANAATMENISILRYSGTDLKERPIQICEEVAELLRRKG